MPRRLIALTAVLLVAAACTRSGSEPESPKVAVFEDMSVETASYLVTPSFQGMRLAFLQAEVAGGPDVEVVPFDTRGDPATALQMANDVAADPTYVAVIAAPFWLEPPAVGTAFARAGLPTLSLSSRGPPSPTRGWYRLVPSEVSATRALNGALRSILPANDPLCVAGAQSRDDSPLTAGYGEVLQLGALRDGASLAVAVSTIKRFGCGVAWTGYAGGAQQLLDALATTGIDHVRFAGTSALKTETFLSQSDQMGEGTVVVCPCADISATSDPAGQRFIHDYQAEFTSPPWPYSAEGYDAAGMLVRALSGGSSRSAVKGALDAASPYEGVARTYAFGSTGELVDQAVGVFRDEGQRWEPLAPTYVTPGVLTMSSCLEGFPFAYEEHGRARGFDVELGAAIAKQLGVGFRWEACGASGHTPRAVDVTLQLSDGSPTALSLHVAQVTRSDANGHSCPIKMPTCVIGLTRDPAVHRLGTTTPLGTVYREFGSTEHAYDALEYRQIGALWDVEYRAWTEIERRTDLMIVRTSEGSRYSLIANDPGLQTNLDGALATVLDDGTYALLFAKYFPGTPIPPETGT